MPLPQTFFFQDFWKLYMICNYDKYDVSIYMNKHIVWCIFFYIKNKQLLLSVVLLILTI